MPGCTIFIRTYGNHCREMKASYIVSSIKITSITKYSSLEFLNIGVFLNAEEGDFVIFKGLNFRMQDKLPF